MRPKKQTEGPVKLNALFEVYKKRLRAPQGSVVLAAQEVIADITGLAVPEDYLAYTPHTRVLTIRVRGPKKAEILIHQEEILVHLKARLGPGSAPHTLL